MLNNDIRRILHNCTLFTTEEISLVHVSHMSSTCLTPNTHLMRIFLSVSLDRGGDASIWVTLAKDGVNSTSKDGGIPCLDGAFFVVGWFVGVERYVVAFGAEFGNACVELRDWRRDVWEFDYNCTGLFAVLSISVKNEWDTHQMRWKEHMPDESKSRRQPKLQIQDSNVHY